MVKLEDGGVVTATIIDLGLAKTAGKSNVGTVISTLGSFSGTPEYSSPEQFAGFGVDIRSDLYSLGVTLWEMVTGQIPFHGTGLELMYHHQRTPLPLDQLDKLPQPMINLLESLLAKDPEWRFQHPVDLLRGLPSISAACKEGRLMTDQRFRSVSETNSTAEPIDIDAPLNTEDLSSYEHYFRGIALLEVGDPEAKAKAIEHLRKGVPLLGELDTPRGEAPPPRDNTSYLPDSGELPHTLERIEKAENKRLVGVWQVNILPENETIPLLSIANFGADGSFSTTTNRLLPPIPGIHAIATELGPGYGAWISIGNNKFRATFYSVLRNKRGRVSGFQRVEGTIELSPSGDEHHGTGEVDFFDSNWNIVFSTTTVVDGKKLKTPT
jgi:serine/threonine protein kinase